MPIQRAAPRPIRDAADNNVLELTWDVFGELCRALAVKVAQSGYAPEIVVGIAKAGAGVGSAPLAAESTMTAMGGTRPGERWSYACPKSFAASFR